MVCLPPHSEATRTLAAAIRAVFEPARSPVRVDAALAELAIRRHRVGPLLHAGLAHGALEAPGAVSARLARHALINARSIGLGQMVQNRAVRALAEAGIPSLVIKGLPLAEQLYPDPLSRHIGDIDLLVWPRDFTAASAALASISIKPQDGELSLHGHYSALSRRLVKDVHLIEAATGILIELHQRLFLVEPAGAAMTWLEGFSPCLADPDAPASAPPPGAGLAHYLLLHGAISGWKRMKWLIDSYLLVPRLPPAEANKLIAAAEAARTTLSVKASLIFLRGLFDIPLPAALESWIAETAPRGGIARRIAHFTKLLNETAETQRSETYLRFRSLKSTLLLLETAPLRLKTLIRGPLSSGLHMAARQFPGNRHDRRA